MWNLKEIDKGRHPENKDIVFRFEYSGIKKILTATGSCGCTHVQLDNNVVEGYVKPKKIDEVVPSIVSKKEYTSEQLITVVFEDNTIDVLKVRATIVPA